MYKYDYYLQQASIKKVLTFFLLRRCGHMCEWVYFYVLFGFYFTYFDLACIFIIIEEM